MSPLPPPGRLIRRADFLRAAAAGRKVPMPGLVLQARRREDEAPARLGFTATKKLGGAVTRNRVKRRLRAAARLVLEEAPVRGVDLVLVGRAGTAARPFALLLADLRAALQRGVAP